LSLLVFVLTDWSTSGGNFIAGTQTASLITFRNTLLLSVEFILVLVMLLTRSRRARAMLGPKGLEHVAVMLTALLLVVGTISYPWCLVKVFEVDGSNLQVTANSADQTEGLLLLLDVLITGSHIALPVRWVVMWPTEVVAVLCYGVAAFVWSSCTVKAAVSNLLMITALVVASALGRRTVEHLERMAFARVAAEKSLRFQVEYRLERMTKKMRRPASPTAGPGPIMDDSRSLPTTTRSDEMFASMEDMSDEVAKQRLEQLADLGYSEHWLVPESELQPRPERIVGVGGFGVVMAAWYHGATVVLKAPRTTLRATHKRSLASIAHELRICRRLHHPNIVLFYGACIDSASSEILLVLEYVRGSPLDSFIRVPPASPSTMDRCKLANDVCCALRYLHTQRPCIVHGDIKGSNVLVEQAAQGCNAKLVDFGLGRLITKQAMPLGGTLNWMAPEVMLGGGCRPAPSADVFSLGRLLYMVITGRTPLSCVSASEILAAAKEKRPQPLEWPEDIPLGAECRDLCNACLKSDDRARPGILEVQTAVCALASSSSTCEGNSETFMEIQHGSTFDMKQALQKARQYLNYEHTAAAKPCSGSSCAVQHSPACSSASSAPMVPPKGAPMLAPALAPSAPPLSPPACGAQGPTSHEAAASDRNDEVAHAAAVLRL